MSTNSVQHIPVLIVGGGLTGLSTSLFLARQGVSSLLVERHASTALHPKQYGLGLRPMEIFRSLDLEKAIRAAGAELADNTDHLTAFSLTAGEINRQHFPGITASELSPTTLGICPQHKLEPLLLQAAHSHGGDLRFNTELLSFEQGRDGVTATLLERTTGQRTSIRADYLVAADGAHSPIRQGLRIAEQGTGTLFHNISMYFRADLSDVVHGREFGVCVIVNPEAMGVLGPVNNRDLWTFSASYDPAAGQKREDFTTERCIELIRKAIGIPDLAVEIISVLPWEGAMRVAERLQQGHLFLVGDAAHVMPPLGGFGASTGIQDAHNLAWKLALVLKGMAGPDLLATYERERLPVDQFTAQQAALRFTQAGRRFSSAQEHAEVGMAHDLVVMLGYHYASGAVIDARKKFPSLEEVRLDGEPGTRAPHRWIEHNGEQISTLDLFGKGFVLLTGSDAWADAARQVAAHSQLDLAVYQPDTRREDNLFEAYGIAPQGAVLIRPDDFVAWRSSGPIGQAEETLGQVVCRLLYR